ncbi:MAG TPA: sulfite reductase subunit alpha [Verrucomicrobiae bacterium]|jgi:sulfite reductase (NADPH) flavoprotein alpha-component|nr:sulfite reductase subunit alpha [Verrucomicrobiae bacterium]
MDQKEQPAVVPCLPENAPFTVEQRAYLNGFLAGIFSRMPAAAGAAQPAAPVEALIPLSILFGSQTGTAENLAKRMAKEAGQRGFAPTVHDLADYPAAQLVSEERLLMVTSTYGDGEPPDSAKAFWNFLGGPNAPKLSQMRFAVCALGDSNYPKFCGFGKELDVRLESLGAKRAHSRVDCDVDFEEPFSKWLNEALTKIGARGDAPVPKVEARGLGAKEYDAAGKYSRTNPFSAALLINKPLNAPGSAKDTRHFEMDLNGSGLNYEAGDVLGVIPRNCPELVEDMLAALKYSGDESAPGRDGADVSLREAFSGHYEITKISQPFLAAMAERSGDETLKKLAAPGANGAAVEFLYGREMIDLLLAHPSVKFAPAEFTSLLKKLQPRLYSISSSPKGNSGRVHLTVNIVRYESLARRRKGVCSTFLAERVEPARTVPVFVHANKNFRPPPGAETPMIMVGPGTGIAPFRAFLQERRAVGARGRNWLFYGDQRSATDFMYREELESMRNDGILTRLDTAFSRDQAEKVYVQDRMRENAKELFAWLESGAHFYVCGDARRMAKDVDAALHEAIQTGGGRTAGQAVEYVNRLKSEKRYLRDVY